MNFADRRADYIAKKEIDYRIGEYYELQYAKEILTFFNLQDDIGSTLKRHKRYSVIDWVVTKNKEVTQIELKTRSNQKNAYPDTMYNFNKFNRQINDLKNGKISKAYAVFIFSDEMCYYEITKDSLTDVTIKEGGRSDRGYRESSTYAFIPVHTLKTIRRF
jgi:hypothetical protein